MEIFNSNGSLYKFYSNLPNISFIHKMSKSKAILETSTFYVTKISKMSKIKILILEIL